MHRALRVAAVVSVVLLVIVVFEPRRAVATSPTGSEYNHALASHGGVASASGSGGGTSPGRAIDGNTSTYWQSGSTTGWLSVQFAAMAYVNEIHIHFRTVVYSSLSVYFDTNANGAYEATEKLWTTTTNHALDVIATPPSLAFALGAQVMIDLKNGSNNPKINEFEAYMRSDSDGDGLTGAQEAATIYFQDVSPGGCHRPFQTTASTSLPPPCPSRNSPASRCGPSSAASNADDIQAILSGNVMFLDVSAILDLLRLNETGAWVRQEFVLGNDLLLYSLPDGAVRLAAYSPRPTAPSVDYVFCESGCFPPPKPWWEQLWTGAWSTFVGFVTSAFVFAVTAFAKLVEVLVQVGNWLWTNIVGPGIAAVASAVEAAGEALDQFVNALKEMVLAIFNAIVRPLLAPLEQAIGEWMAGVAAVLASAAAFGLDQFADLLSYSILTSPLAFALLAIVVAFSVAEKAYAVATFGVGNLIGVVIGAFMGVILGLFITEIISSYAGSTVFEQLIPNWFDEMTSWTFGIAKLVVVWELKIAVATRPLPSITGVETALYLSILSLLLLGVSTVVSNTVSDLRTRLVSQVTIDVLALSLSLYGSAKGLKIATGWIRYWYPVLFPITVALGTFSLVTSAFKTGTDVARLATFRG